MSHENVRYLFIAFFVVLCILQPRLFAQSSDDQTINSIRDDLDRLAQHQTKTVMDRLREAPRDLVILQVVQRLEDDPDFQAGQSRRSAYQLLLDHRAAIVDVGFQQLLKGVHDPHGRHASLMALRITPETRHLELVEAISPLLHDKDVPEHDLQSVIQLLAKTRNVAASTRATMSDIYHDEDAQDDTRMLAAQGMVLIGGILWAIEKFDVDDIVKASAFEANAIITALAVGGTETKGTFGLEPHFRPIPRTMIARAMNHTDRDVRFSAAGAMLKAYSLEEAVIETAPGEFKAHPNLIQAFTRMIETDPDPELRVLGSRMLHEHLPQLIERRKLRDEADHNDSGSE